MDGPHDPHQALWLFVRAAADAVDDDLLHRRQSSRPRGRARAYVLRSGKLKRAWTDPEQLDIFDALDGGEPLSLSAA